MKKKLLIQKDVRFPFVVRFTYLKLQNQQFPIMAGFTLVMVSIVIIFWLKRLPYSPLTYKQVLQEKFKMGGREYAFRNIRYPSPLQFIKGRSISSQLLHFRIICALKRTKWQAVGFIQIFVTVKFFSFQFPDQSR